jgi:hypothetical protein
MPYSSTRARSPWFFAVVLLAPFLFSYGRASGATLATNWQGPNGGNWSTAANWDINQVPNNTANNIYNVTVTAGANTVNLDIGPTLTHYPQTSGSLIGNNNLSLVLNGAFTWNSGKIDQIPKILATAGTTISKTNPAAMNPTLGNVTLQTQGATTISATPFDGTSGAILQNFGTLTIDQTTTLNDISGGVPNQPMLDNRSVVNKTGNGTATVAWNTFSDGTLETMAGVLKFTGGLNITGGKMIVDKGATLTSTTPIAVNNSSVGGAGTINGSISLFDGTIRGAPTPGKLLVVGDLGSSSNLGSSVSTFDSAVGGPGSSPDYADQVEVDGDVELPQLLDVSVWPGYTPPPTYEYDILFTTGAMTGTFQNALPGQRILSDDGNWSFIVNYETGAYTQEVALTDFQPVPEPSTFALLGIVGAAIFRRPARRKFMC